MSAYDIRVEIIYSGNAECIILIKFVIFNPSPTGGGGKSVCVCVMKNILDLKYFLTCRCINLKSK